MKFLVFSLACEGEIPVDYLMSLITSENKLKASGKSFIYWHTITIEIGTTHYDE